MALLVPFDFILFQNPWIYLPGRIALGTFSAVILLTNPNRLNPSPADVNLAEAILLWLPLAAVNLIYYYFLSVAPEQDTKIVFIGTLMVVIFTTLAIHRFWKEELALILVSNSALGCLLLQSSDMRDSIILLSIAHMISFALHVHMRREFFRSIDEKFQILRGFLPKREAHLVATMSDKGSFETAFKPRTRFNVCLCSDWRKYQNLSRTTSPEDLSKYFERFYDTVFEELEALVPEGTYYVNWVADELFIIFYDQKDDESATIRRAVMFAKSFATIVFEKIQQKFDFELRFDIGLSSGEGFLGLQGPKGLKKTTISSENAGLAKRLETEAKTMRNRISNPSSYPILMMDSRIGKFATDRNIFSESEVQKHSPELADLQGKGDVFVYWDKSGPGRNKTRYLSFSKTGRDP